MKKIIRWICPFCYSKHTDAFVRCVGCGTKRSTRFDVDPANLWIHPHPWNTFRDALDNRGCLYPSRFSRRGEE